MRGIYRNLRATTRWWYDDTRRDYLYWKYEKENPPVDSHAANLTRVASCQPAVRRGRMCQNASRQDHVLPRQASAEGVDARRTGGAVVDVMDIHHVADGPPVVSGGYRSVEDVSGVR